MIDYIGLIEKYCAGNPDLQQVLLQHSRQVADRALAILKAHPEWINKCHELGLTVNVWTVNDKKDMQWFIDMGVDYITTDKPDVLKRMLKNK